MTLVVGTVLLSVVNVVVVRVVVVTVVGRGSLLLMASSSANRFISSEIFGPDSACA
eukprot:CAMPEP_0172934046 /NCGR_PEP_ID=MMETSP1075-20121228/220809_1 /TAXON_ID=2916 /ORGANISM="Ceratium fusus, Strain PA161109" /LENGTH=55 /DNA_ID=CAMNT_0013795393 /DNA_START=643 /DNA_END=810 /DNA_ORIENTATION=-